MNFFRKERELRDVTIEYVCEKLKYSRRTIEDLEGGKTDFLEKPYNFYCAKTYSELLGIIVPKEEIEKFK